MLSAESAAGKYPVEAVKMMAKIVTETETQMRDLPPLDTVHSKHVRLSIGETICESMAHAAEDLDLSAIAVFTETGTTARQLSKYRPRPQIFALSSVEAVINRMTLLWGVHPLRCQKNYTAEQMVDTAERLLEEGGHVRPHEIVGIVAGTRTKSGSTNFLRLHVMGDRLPAGHQASDCRRSSTGAQAQRRGPPRETRTRIEVAEPRQRSHGRPKQVPCLRCFSFACALIPPCSRLHAAPAKVS